MKHKKNDNKKNINKKILESKRIIKEEKAKIKKERQNIRKKKYAKIKNTKVYQFFANINHKLKFNKTTYSFSDLFIATSLSLLVGAFACFSIFVILAKGRNYLKIGKELDKFIEVYETITSSYYGDVDTDTLIEDAIQGMISSVGDVYTSYSDTEGTDEFNQLVSGTYDGIGCTIQLQTDGLKIVQVFDDSPASKSGLEVGDIILKVDDIDITSDTDSETIANYIKNKSSDKITLIIKRNEEEITINLTKEEIETPVVSKTTFIVSGKTIGYIDISLFSSVSYKQFKNAISELEKEDISGLVIDVRGNNGGYLSNVSDIISMFLEKGDVIYQVEADDETTSVKDKTSEHRTYPVAVLINGGSASASEILAAAIKESYGGYVVGTTSYGKGTVQQVKTLSDGSMIKYTIENWLTPNGNWINDAGIEPTNVIELSEEYYSNPSNETDNQLQCALELVSTQE